MGQPQNSYFAVTPPGLEELCRQELVGLGLADLKQVAGGVEFAGGLRELYLANLWLRSATRVLVRLGEDFSARDFPTLFQRLQRLPWGRFIKPATACSLRVSSRQSRLIHSERIAETALAAISKALGRASSASPQGQQVFLRLVDDRCQVSLDSSGELLHRRGYRRTKSAAPLRENLAAACLLALGYDGRQQLVDPMAGSGTFAIEGALISLKRPPGENRSFAFQSWPKYRSGLWALLADEARRQQLSALRTSICAVDSNPLAVRAAEQNLAAADLSGAVELREQKFQTLDGFATKGLLVCNPPYGERLGQNAQLDALYRDLGRSLRESFAGWQAALVCPESTLLKQLGVPLVRCLSFSNGGIPVCLWERG